MKDSRRAVDNFESQLQQRLTKIAQSKSHKKLPAKQLQQWSHGKPKIELDKYSNIMMGTNENQQDILRVPLGKNSQASDQSQGRSSQSAQSKDESKAADQSSNRRVAYRNIETQSNNQEIGTKLFEKISPNSLLESVSNKQVHSFIVRNCGADCSEVELSYFLAKCLAEYSPKPELPQSEIKHIFLSLQQEITTTNPNIVSMNALELAIKKSNSNSLHLYILQKIMHSEYHVLFQELKQKAKLQEKQHAVSMSTAEKLKQQTDSKEKEIIERERKLEQRDKEVSKKEKALTAKQKQIGERIKTGKKQLQEKSKSLSQSHMSELNTAFDKISNKINSYERNMKYRIDSLTQKTNQIHRLREFKQEQVRQQVSKQLDDKYEKRYQARIKKMENSISELTEKLEKTAKAEHDLEEENNKLMKIINKLETKHQKEESRGKLLCQQISSRKCEIKQLQYLLQKKEEENEHLVRKLAQNGHLDLESMRSNDKPKQEIRIDKNKSKKSLSNRKEVKPELSRPNRNSSDIHQGIIECYESVFQVLNTFNQVLHIKLNGKLQNLIMEVSINIIAARDIKCKNLINFEFLNASIALNTRFQSPFQPKFNNQITQNAVTIFEARPQALQKEDGWKLCFLLYVGTALHQSQLWLQKLFNLSQHEQIQSNMHFQASKSEQSNFITAMLIKFAKDIQTSQQENKSFNERDLSSFAILTDFVIEFRVIGEKKYAMLWEGAIGKFMLAYFCDIVRALVKSQKNTMKNIQSIQKISILIQRLLVGYEIKLDAESLKCLERLQSSSSPESLLYQNLSSIRHKCTQKWTEFQQRNDINNKYAL